MEKLEIRLKNCFGIKELDYLFDFGHGQNASNPKSKVYAIYAPNGLMKSSFAKTFDALSRGDLPREERYNRQSTCVVEGDGLPLSSEAIYVLKSEIDISSDSPGITNILVNPDNKAKYDSILIELDKLKRKLINAFQKKSKVKKDDVEQKIIADFGIGSFSECMSHIKSLSDENDLAKYEYATIFDPKSVEVLESPDFIDRANDFNQRYQELFNQDGTIYKKGVFNPAKAEASFSTLEKQGFFAGGHRVHLKGEASSIDKEELDKKIQLIHARIDGDENLKKLRLNLAKNAQTQALTDLIESLSASEVEFLLDKLRPENRDQFRKELWTFYAQQCVEAESYLDCYESTKDEISQIESAAAQVAPIWTDVVSLFNERFVDMPFTLGISNQLQAALGKEQAKLKFIFADAGETVECSRSEIKTLSQGERRALYLLNFIFDVEARKISNKETLFVIDDVADSFDYKNKHAIIQYLDDLRDTSCFHQIILTHNFDFFRSLINSFVPYDRCLMANKSSSSITLVQAEGVKNYFIGKWKNKVETNDRILCATIPFVRNLIEYTKGDKDVDYLKLTSLLHWKIDTDQITIDDYVGIYNRLFGSSYVVNRSQSVKDILFREASAICNQATHEGLNLEDKVLLSIAIRLLSEIFVTDRIRSIKGDQNYWCQSNNQFGSLMKEFESLNSSAPEIKALAKVSLTVSSNIHLNSFMYEPILDLSIEHLISLYREIRELFPAGFVV